MTLPLFGLALLGACAAGDSKGGMNPPDLASLTIAPAVANIYAGDNQLFRASGILLDGGTVADLPVEWTATGGTITSGGDYSAGSTPGTYRVVGRDAASGLADTSTVVVAPVPPVDTVLRHLPAGMSLVIDEPWNLLQPPGWSLQVFGQDKVAIIQDPTAPKSPASVIQFTYQGNVGGEGAGARSIAYAGKSSQYIAFWFRHSSNWEYHSSCVNKMMYYSSNASSGNNENIILNDCGSISVIEQNDVSRRLRSNVGSGDMALGRWHFLEMTMTASTGGQANGTLDWWVDGVHRGHYTDVVWKSSGDALFDGIDFDPIWGGGPETAPLMYYWVDHLVVATN